MIWDGSCEINVVRCFISDARLFTQFTEGQLYIDVKFIIYVFIWEGDGVGSHETTLD